MHGQKKFALFLYCGCRIDSKVFFFFLTCNLAGWYNFLIKNTCEMEHVESSS